MTRQVEATRRGPLFRPRDSPHAPGSQQGETQDNENVRDVRLSARRAQGCRRRPRRVASQIAPSRRHRPQLRRRGRDQDLRRQDRRPPEGDRRGRRRGRPRHGVPPRARRLRRHHPGEERGHRRPRQVRVLRPGRRRLRMALRHRPVAHAPPRQVPRAVHRGGQEARGLHGHRARRPRLPRALRRSHLPRPPLRHRKDAQATRRGGIRRGGADTSTGSAARAPPSTTASPRSSSATPTPSWTSSTSPASARSRSR